MILSLVGPDHDPSQQVDQATTQAIECLSYGGGGHSLVSREPGSRDCRGGRAEDDTRDTIETGTDMTEHSEHALADIWPDNFHAAETRAKNHEATTHYNRHPQALADSHHAGDEEREEDVVPPVSKHGDIRGFPGFKNI